MNIINHCQTKNLSKKQILFTGKTLQSLLLVLKYGYTCKGGVFVYTENLQQFLKANNGYITTKELGSIGITRPMIKQYIDKKIIRKLEHGLYIANHLCEDELYVLQKKNPAIIYSYNTAFFIMGESEKIPSNYDITVPLGKRPRNNKKLKIHQVNNEKYNIGIITVSSNENNPPFSNASRKADLMYSPFAFLYPII